MLKIRLRQFGKKNARRFRIVLTDTRTPRDGKYIESLGHYNPQDSDDQRGMTIDVERVNYWKQKGAQVSETVESLIHKRR